MWLAIGVVIVLAIPTWYLASPLFIVTHGTEEAPEGFASVVATGSFVDGEPGHHASGQATILTDGTAYILRFEEFDVTNGPDIHVFLSRGPQYAEGDLDLGPVKATRGSSNYAIPSNVDPREYTHVIIWCVPFRVQFGSASLSFA